MTKQVTLIYFQLVIFIILFYILQEFSQFLLLLCSLVGAMFSGAPDYFDFNTLAIKQQTFYIPQTNWFIYTFSFLPCFCIYIKIVLSRVRQFYFFYMESD